MKSSRVDIQGIECLQVSGDNSGIGVIFLHGYGANMHDLFPLWEMWHHEGFNWYFPNGVQTLNMGYYEGRAWFSIDIAEFEKAMREGRHRDMKNFIPPEMDHTLSQLEQLIFEISKKHKKVILGGFSQGAMCASHLVMKKGINVDGLVLLSGGLVAGAKFPSEAKSVPFYQSHGSADPVLSVDGARDLEKKLHSLNFPGKLTVFNGGHEIPPLVIHEVKSFLKQFV